MSVFRSAQFLTSLGHSLKCNQLHKRRMVSLGITSLCQIIGKKRGLLDTNALHVNKLDLSSIGIHSPTSATSSSTRGRTDESTVFVGCSNFNYDESYLSHLFSQFGEVKYVYIPKEVQGANSPGSYGYAFVAFCEEESTKKAVRSKTVTADGRVLVIKLRDKPPKEVTAIKRTYVVKGLPDDINVKEVHDYFKSFGDVELVNLFFDVPSVDDSNIKSTIAFVVFNKYARDFIAYTMNHKIGNSNITVEKVSSNAKNQKRFRCHTVFLEGIPDSITREEIGSYFKSIGSVRLVTLLANQFGKRNGSGVVHFTHQKYAQSAAHKFIHEISGASVKVRAMGYEPMSVE